MYDIFLGWEVGSRERIAQTPFEFYGRLFVIEMEGRSDRVRVDRREVTAWSLPIRDGLVGEKSAATKASPQGGK